MIDVKLDCNRFCNGYNVLQARQASIRRFSEIKFEHKRLKMNCPVEQNWVQTKEVNHWH